MKKIRTLSVLALAAAASCPASAAPVEVLRRSLPPLVSVVGTHFSVDEKAGRALLAVDYYDGSFEGSSYSELVAVPGLVFDRARREVLWEDEGADVACAVPRRVLWATAWRETGACRFVVTGEDPPEPDAATTAVVRLVTSPRRPGSPAARRRPASPAGNASGAGRS